MSAPDDETRNDGQHDGDELDRQAILARRQALLRRAVRSVGVAVLSAATANCFPCLSISASLHDADADASPQPCLSPTATPPDSAVDASDTSDASDASDMSVGDITDGTAPDAPDAEPMPCLSPPLTDGGPERDGGVPLPCLSMPPPDAGR